MKLILASNSPRRRELIQKVTTDVDFLSNSVDEDVDSSLFNSPKEIAMEIARQKALLNKDSIDENAAILGSDTIVVVDDVIYGKPKDEKEAYAMLSSLSNNTHSVITGVSIITPDNKEDTFFTETKVSFNPLTQEMIESYIATGDPFDKAGGYGIQNLPNNFVRCIEGDYNNIVGLPVKDVEKHLKELNII